MMIKNIGVALLAGLVLCGCGGIDAQEPARFIPDWRQFRSEEAAISFEYPYNLSLEEDESSGGGLRVELLWKGNETPVFQVETGSADPDWVAEGGTEVDGVKATETMVRIGGEPMRRIAVSANGNFYTFTGSGRTFEKVLDSVEFLK